MLGCTTNGDGLVADPSGVVTTTGPESDPRGTVALICVSESTENFAVVPLNVTIVAPTKLMPAILTVMPGVPRAGSIPVTTGTLACATPGSSNNAAATRPTALLRNAL